MAKVNPIVCANDMLSVTFWINVKAWVSRKKDLAIKIAHFQLLWLVEFCMIFKYGISLRFQLIIDKFFLSCSPLLKRFSFLEHRAFRNGTEYEMSDILSVVFSENSNYKAGLECTQHQFLSEGRILGLSDFS